MSVSWSVGQFGQLDGRSVGRAVGPLVGWSVGRTYTTREIHTTLHARIFSLFSLSPVRISMTLIPANSCFCRPLLNSCLYHKNVITRLPMLFTFPLSGNMVLTCYARSRKIAFALENKITIFALRVIFSVCF